MRYLGWLVLCGLGWGCLSLGLLDYVTPVASITASIVTAIAVGLIQRHELRRATGSTWYVLPLLSVLIAMACYGVTEPAMEWLVGGKTWNSGHVEIAAFWRYPLWFVWYGLTLFSWLTYPLALATHVLLRKFALPAKA